jgi:hypothetical protein
VLSYPFLKQSPCQLDLCLRGVGSVSLHSMMINVFAIGSGSFASAGMSRGQEGSRTINVPQNVGWWKITCSNLLVACPTDHPATARSSMSYFPNSYLTIHFDSTSSSQLAARVHRETQSALGNTVRSNHKSAQRVVNPQRREDHFTRLRRNQNAMVHAEGPKSTNCLPSLSLSLPHTSLAMPRRPAS